MDSQPLRATLRVRDTAGEEQNCCWASDLAPWRRSELGQLCSGKDAEQSPHSPSRSDEYGTVAERRVGPSPGESRSLREPQEPAKALRFPSWATDRIAWTTTTLLFTLLVNSDPCMKNKTCPLVKNTKHMKVNSQKGYYQVRLLG